MIQTRGEIIRDLGLGLGSVPFLTGLPSLTGAERNNKPKRLVIMFSPNGTIPHEFWPDEEGSIKSFKTILKPLEPYRSRTSVINGLYNLVRGDGDNHMRGMSCLLTGTELFPGNIQGGSHTPAGWAKGISIDQEIRHFFQSKKETRTRFGSLEFGVAVPNRADPWTRMSYAGPNKPLAPIDDPKQILDKLYGATKDKDSLLSIVDAVRADFRKVSSKLSREDRQMLEEHMDLVSEMERDLKQLDENKKLNHPVPQIDTSVEITNDNIPKISRMQIDLMVNSLANDMCRVASLQYTRSVGQAKMTWLGIKDGHHGLSHEPDGNKDAQDKLIKINTWFAGELAYLAKRLKETPEPGGAGGSMLDNTFVLWTNELGKGNSHTLNNIPMVCMGGENLGMKNGRSIKFKKEAHNRFHMRIAKMMGHELNSFGLESLCKGGAIDLV